MAVYTLVIVSDDPEDEGQITVTQVEAEDYGAAEEAGMHGLQVQSITRTDTR